ncbi:MAG: GTP pyrophosphokinase [Christensenellales bacterium]
MENKPAFEQLQRWQEMMLLYRSAIAEVNTKLNILNDEFQMTHRYNPIEHLKSRIKSPESIANKLRSRGLEVTIQNAFEQINDIAGIRIICSFVPDIYLVYEMLRRQNDITILRVKDYIAHPKPSGYRSLHVLMSIPIFLSERVQPVKVEVQIRTIAMDFWASLEHKLYYKHHDNTPHEVSEQLRECAQLAADLDEKMLQIKDRIAELERRGADVWRDEPLNPI